MKTRERRALRLIVTVFAAMGLMLGGLMFAGSPAAAQNQRAICHATESEQNPFTFIGPDDASYDAHLAHFGSSTGFGFDRFATAEEAAAGQCFATIPPTEAPPTEVPPTEPPPTEPLPTEPAPTEPAPTEPAPTEPGATEPAPKTPAATKAPAPTTAVVTALPDTGSGDSGSSGGLLVLLIGAVVVLGAGALLTRRPAER